MPVGVAYMDMNGLKVLNDQHDHDAGDRGLRMYFRAVVSALGDEGEAYRLGGDEVLAIVPRSDSAKTARLIEGACLRLMHDSLDAPPKIRLSISAGVVAATDPLARPAAVRKDADLEQKRAKDASRRADPQGSVITVAGVERLQVIQV
jgi:diguanylate cyclase (GGDEF)-like protein